MCACVRVCAHVYNVHVIQYVYLCVYIHVQCMYMYTCMSCSLFIVQDLIKLYAVYNDALINVLG